METISTTETLKIIKQYDAMTTITLVASLVTIFVFILLVILWGRYEKCRSERNSARFTIDRLKDDLKFLHKKHDKLANGRVVLKVFRPAKRDGETDRQYEQRCRMMVTNKAYEYVQFTPYSATLTVLK